MLRHIEHLSMLPILLIVFLVAGCTPRTVSPTPAPQPTVSPTTVPAKTTLSPEEEAWQRTINAARNEERLIIYDMNIFIGDAGRAIASAFKNKYGVTVEFLITGGSSSTIEKLKVEQKMGAFVADAVTAGSVSARGMIELKMMKDVSRELPVLKDKNVFVMDPVYSPGGEALSIRYDRLAPAVNSNLVKAGEVQSFRDLLDPKWKGKIAARDPRLGSGAEPLVVTTYRYLKILDDEYFVRLAAQKPVLLGVAANEVAQMVARGDYAVDWASSIEAYFAPVIDQGGPLAVVPAKEGTIAQSSVIMVLNSARHPNAAKLFTNWMLSAEGQTILHEAKATPSIRKDLRDFSPPSIAKLKFEKIIPFTWEIADQVNAEVKAGVMEKFFGKR